MSVLQGEDRRKARWFEVDFKEVTQKKAAIIAGNAALHEQLGPDAKDRIHPGTLNNCSEDVAVYVASWSLLDGNQQQCSEVT